MYFYEIMSLEVYTCYSLYIDDSFIMDQNLDGCITSMNTEEVVQMLDKLCFRINFEKLVLIPWNHIVFLCLIIDTELFKFFMTDEKW